jgi:hypothetical protein
MCRFLSSAYIFWIVIGCSVLLMTCKDPISTDGCQFSKEFIEDFESFPTDVWNEGETQDTNWYVNWNGGGLVGVEIDSSLGSANHVHFQIPAPPDPIDTTHSCLVTSTFAVGDFEMRVQIKTIRQLRTPSPNAWEAAWVLWHLTDPDHLYYFVLKTNGWELGKRDPTPPRIQKILKDGRGTPSLSLGGFNEVWIKQVGSHISISLNGSDLITFQDTASVLLQGKFGLYNEDAYVHFDDFHVCY